MVLLQKLLVDNVFNIYSRYKKLLFSASAPCPTGYVRHPSGSCVNLLIDFNNCGSINYVCASTYISCSAGNCSSAPAILLVGGVAVPGWGVTVDIDDAYAPINVSFHVTLYSTTTSTINVQSNGVSAVLIDLTKTFQLRKLFLTLLLNKLNKRINFD